MQNIRKCDERILRRRRDYLQKRTRINGMEDTGFSYDKAEYEALTRVLEAIDAEKANI